MASAKTLLRLIAAFLLMAAATPFSVQPRGAEASVPQNYPYNIICSVPGYRDSGTDHLNSLIKHLKDLDGNATLGHQPGGGWCWRYSCQNNIGVYACNDNEAQDVLVAWSLLVEYAEHLNRTCTIERKIDGKWTQRILGQAFHSDGWNAIVGISTEEGC